MYRVRWLTGLAIVVPAISMAGEADVVSVDVTHTSGGNYSFHVTVAHADTGWDHYADNWQVVGPDGAVLGERILVHPHVDEQPFTRSLTGVSIPAGVTTVTIRAGDSVHEFGGKEIKVNLPQVR